MLKLSMMYNVQSGAEYALQLLMQHPDCSEAQRAMVAWMTRQDDMYEIALRRLMFWNVEHWSVNDIETIDSALFLHIVRTQDAVSIRRHERAIRPPRGPFPEIQCPNTYECYIKWCEGWRGYAAPILVQSYPERDPEDEVKSDLTSASLQVCTYCFTAHFGNAEVGFAEDRRVIDDAVMLALKGNGFRE